MTKRKEKTFLDRISLGFDKLMLSNIVLTALFLVFGVVIYLNPVITLKTVGIVIGVAFIIFGLFDIYEFLTRANNPLFSLRIVLGILTVILGVFTLMDPFKITKLLTFSLGIYLSILAIFKIIEAFKLKKYGFDGWVLMLVVSVLLLIFGVFIGINPMASVDLVEATGIFVILASILEICNLLMLYTKAKDIMKLIKKNI